jgi:hypothetical protein
MRDSLRHGGSGRFAAILIGVMLAAAMAQAVLYWPGIMIWDSIRQYREALNGRFDDWHPPILDWLWRQLTVIAPGPATMLVLQLLLYWGGYALLVAWAARQGRRALAVALGLCALFPLALGLIGVVMKDSLMAATLVAAAALIAWTLTGRAAWGRVPAILLLLFAAALRFNAVLACLPLLIAALPASWRATPVRLVVSATAGLALLLVVLPAVNSVLRARPTGVELSLVIFDLGGITENSGTNVFPPVPGIDDPVAVNHGCYDPVKWDPYSWWVDEPCAIGFTNLVPALYRTGKSPYRLWLQAIAAHPIAYAEHRLAHFNANSRFLVRSEVVKAVPDQSDPNPWNYRIQPTAPISTLDGVVTDLEATPLEWPIWWIGLAAGLLLLAPLLPSRTLITALGLSSLLYGLGYLVLSVASEMRYHLWTMMAALVAAVLTASDLARLPQLPVRRLAAALMLPALIAVVGLAWRIA